MKIPVLLQTEASECALACLGMISNAHGSRIDLADLRRRFVVSLKGTTLEQLMRYAAKMNFSSRAVRLEMEELRDLSLPCILHWDMAHFVVLKKATKEKVQILDPALGERNLDIKEVSRHFTGVALELLPNAQFKPIKQRKRTNLRELTGKVYGLNRSLLQIFCVSVLLQLLGLIAPLISQLIVDDVLSSHDRSLLPVVMIGFSLVLLIQTIVSMARSWMILVLTQSLSLQWYSNVFNHLLRLPLAYFEKRHLGDLLSRFNSIDTIQRTLTTNVITGLLDAITGIAAMVMMFLYSPKLATIALISVALYACVRLLSYRAYRQTGMIFMSATAKESSHFLETMRAILPLKLFGREQERAARWQNLRVEVQNRNAHNTVMNIGFTAANTLIFGIQNLAVSGVGALLIMDAMKAGGSPTFTVGMFFAFGSYCAQFTNRFSSMINYAVELHMLGLHSERLGDITMTEPEVSHVPDNELTDLAPRIELRNVSFRYGEGEPWILNKANLVVEPGENVALVGSSGSGKSTLLKVMLGLLKPNEGEVLYGGVNINKLGIQNYRRLIGTVMQEDVLLAGSISENISFFSVRIDDERLRRCAELAAVDREILKMPMGFQTLVGDMGSSLSGGQKQRILLARAFYKQPKIMALDEATSHLDVGNERLVNHQLNEMNITRIVVAHRPETIAAAKRVVELANGRLRERNSSPVPSN